MTTTKRCTKCGEEKPLDGFDKSAKGRFGRRARCKCCEAKYVRENAEKIKAQRAKYRRENAEKIKVGKAEHYRKNVKKIAEQQAKYRRENAEKIAPRAARYRCKTAEKTKAQKAASYRKNIEKIAEQHAKYRRELAPGYVASLLQIPHADLTPELLELKREQLRIHRLTNQLKKELKNV